MSKIIDSSDLIEQLNELEEVADTLSTLIKDMSNEHYKEMLNDVYIEVIEEKLDIETTLSEIKDDEDRWQQLEYDTFRL